MKHFLRQVFEQFDSFRTWSWLLLFLMISWVLSFVNDEFITTDSLIDSYWSEVMEERYDDYDAIAEEFEDELEDFEDEEEANYVSEFFISAAFLAVGKFIQFSLITAGMYISFTLTRETENVKLKHIFKIIVIAQFVFLIPLIVKYIWFLGFKESYTYKELINFSVLSVYSFFEPSGIPDWLVYPLKILNLFEVIYVLTIATGLSTLYKLHFSEVARATVLGYGSLLILWIAVRIYFSVII